MDISAIIYYVLVLLLLLCFENVESLSSSENTALCAIVAATNIETVTLGQWSCSIADIPVTDPCSPAWTGLVCSENESVNSISFSNWALQGTFPLAIGNLTSLTMLNITESRIYGDIPETISMMKNLSTVALHSNMLNGTIPSSLWSLNNLTALVLFKKLSQW